MKLSRVAVLAIALGAGIVAAFLALNMSAPTAVVEAPVQSEPADTVEVLVAARQLPMGVTLVSGSTAWRPWPRSGLAPNLIQRTPGVDDQSVALQGAIVRATIYEGEPINDAKLIRSDRGFMSAILPAGKRAIATKIAADTSAGGFILPNDRVDVIMTRRADPAGGSTTEFLTETILNNVRVLAIDQTIEEKSSGEGATAESATVIGQTATLELTPQQAQILTVAQQMAERLTLALRSISDSDIKAEETSGDAVHLIGGTKRNGAVTVVKNGVARDVTGIR